MGRLAGLTSKVAVLPASGVDFGPEERQSSPPWGAQPRSGQNPSLAQVACQQALAAAQVVGHGPEPDLQTGFGEPEQRMRLRL